MTVTIRGRTLHLVDGLPSTRFFVENHKTWELDTFDTIDQFVQGGVFVDIGAHIGVFSIYAAPRASQVIAVEPDPVAFAELERNIAANFLRNVTAVNKAVWSHSGKVMLYAHPEGLGSAMTGPSRDGAPLLVNGITVDGLRELFTSPVVDLVKVDTEGSETRIVPQLLGWDVPIHLSLHVEEMGGELDYGDRKPVTLVDHPAYPVVLIP